MEMETIMEEKRQASGGDKEEQSNEIADVEGVKNELGQGESTPVGKGDDGNDQTQSSDQKELNNNKSQRKERGRPRSNQRKPVGRPPRQTAVVHSKLGRLEISKKLLQEENTKSKSRKDFKNYDEMVACINLLRYMDWEKLNPKSHQNSPFHNPPMTPICYWFMICAKYFPRGYRDQIDGLFKQLRTQTSAGINTIVAPIYYSLLKKLPDHNKAKHKNASTSNQNSQTPSALTMNVRPKKYLNTGDSEPLGDLSTILQDKKNEKKYRLEYSFRDDVFLMQSRCLLRKNTDHVSQDGKATIDDMIHIYEELLDAQSCTIEQDVKTLTRIVESERNNDLLFEGTFHKDYLLKDLQITFEDEKKFLDNMEYRQQNMVAHNVLDTQQKRNQYIFPEKERPKKSEDYVCQICNDGDYTEENQIVFCEGCNISFHQRCYGIGEIPDGIWVCDLCRYYGPDGKYVRCILCTRKGGCLRRVNIPAKSEFWKSRNKAFWEFQNGGPCEETEPPRTYKDGADLVEKSKSSDNEEEYLYYDYYKELDKWKLGDDEMEPRTRLTWAHLSCCYWINDLLMTYEEVPNRVKNFEVMDKARFNLECIICGSKEGACVQCSARSCHESFHVECARRVKMFMETKNSENRFFTIYCERHAPLMAKRKLDSNSISNCNTIVKFCRHIEKHYESYKGRFLERPKEEETPAFIRLVKKKKLEKNSAANSIIERLLANPFIRSVKNELLRFPDFGNIINIELDSSNNPQAATYEPPKKTFLKSALNKHHKVWMSLAKKNSWQYNNIFKKYKRILMGSKEDPFEGLPKIKIPKVARTKGNIFFVENTESKIMLQRIQ